MLLPLLLSCAPSFQSVDWIEPFLRATRALETGAPRAALRDLDAAARILPDHPQILWQQACVHALLGESDAAFEYLQDCLELGGVEATLLNWDPDLDSLREDARFASLLEILRARGAGTSEPWFGQLEPTAGGDVSVGPYVNSISLARGPAAFLLDGRTREVLTVLDRQGESSARAKISPDGRWVVIGGDRDEGRTSYLRVHEARTGGAVRDLEDVGWQPHMQFSVDSRRMLATGGGPQRSGAVWQTSDWTIVHRVEFDHDQSVLSPAGDRLLLLSRSGDHSGNVVLWDVDAEAVIAQRIGMPVIPNAALGFSSDGTLAFVLENRGTSLRVLDGRSGTELSCIRPPGLAAGTPGQTTFNDSRRFASAAFVGTDGEIATVNAGERIRIWNARSGQLVREFDCKQTEDWMVLEASADGRTLCLGGFARSPSAYDVVSGTQLWSEPPGALSNTALSPDGTRIVESTWGCPATVRDVRTGEVQARMDAFGLATEVVADPKADAFWVAASDGSIRRIDARSGRATRSWTPGRARILHIAISADGERIATIDSAGVSHVVRTESGDVEARFETAPNRKAVWSLTDLQFSPSNKALLVSRPPDFLRVLAAPDWHVSFTPAVVEPTWGHAFSPDGSKVLIAAKGGLLHVLDSQTGAPMHGPYRITGEVQAFGLEPGGQRIWIGSDQSMIHVFETADGSKVRDIGLQDLDALDTVEVGSIQFRSDGKLAIVASSGWGVVAAFDTANGKRVWNYNYDGGNPSPLHSAFDPAGERVFVWGQGHHTPRIVEAKTGRMLVDLKGRYRELLPLASDERIGGSGRRGLEGVRTRDGRALWSRIETATEGWILSSAERFVDGTPEALALIHMALAEGSLPLDALAASLLDPKRVRAAAEGVELSPARLHAVPELVQIGTYERVLKIQPEEKAGKVTFEASCADGIQGFEVRVDGHVVFQPGEEIDGTKRRLALSIAVGKGVSAPLRVRALSSKGMRSRALHTTLEGR